MAPPRRDRAQPLWRVALAAPDADAADAAAQALSTEAIAVSAFTAPGGSWRVEGLCEGRPDRAALEAALALAWLAQPEPPPTLAIDRVPPQDWLAENRASFPP